MLNTLQNEALPYLKGGIMGHSMGVMRGDPAKGGKNDDEKKEGEEDAENLRLQKLLNSKDNN